MSVNFRVQGPLRDSMRCLLAALEDFALGVGPFEPGCGLDEEESNRVAQTIEVVRSLLAQRVPSVVRKDDDPLAFGGRGR